LDAFNFACGNQPFRLRVFDGAVKGLAARGCLLLLVSIGWVLSIEFIAYQLDIDRTDDWPVGEGSRVETGIGQHGHEYVAQ
jgi:hypothetical protein